ncbi:MAG: organoarsenical effux MFS transporter ArsJ [Alphaproteobacteria bacterium]
MATHNTKRNYLTVTLSYWGFTLTDGALRMIVLLHFYKIGFSPLTIALLFLLYEFAGIIANLFGGWLTNKHGVTRVLIIGLVTQIMGLLILSALSPSWGVTASVIWVVIAQGICGVAKDLTKTASKSAIKIISSTAPEMLFRWVAWFTGSKNAMKGLGFFLGGGLLQFLGFQEGLWLLSAALATILLFVIRQLPAFFGQAQSSKSIKELFSKNTGVNLLAFARIFLFGARDIWFVVGVPVYLYTAGWNFTMVGAFLALWTIGYGCIQGIAPNVIKRSKDGLSTEVPASKFWAFFLFLSTLPILAWLDFGWGYETETLVVGLCFFGIFFAVNSSVHSYLVLAYAGSEKAAEDVGFYYAANALGRFLGTFLSGTLYGFGGIKTCIFVSCLFLAINWCAALYFPKSHSN